MEELKTNEAIRQFLREIGKKGGEAGKGGKKPRKSRSNYAATWGRPKGGKTTLQASKTVQVSAPGEDKAQTGITRQEAIERLLEEGKTLREAEMELNAINATKKNM